LSAVMGWVARLPHLDRWGEVAGEPAGHVEQRSISLSE
jgi:hypothetical protein